MKETTIESFSANVSTLLDEAQHERILVTRDGKPFAFVVGVADKDQEDLKLEGSSEFWRMIEERRRSSCARLADLESELFAKDA